MREITSLGDKVNKYVNDYAPWNLIKTDPEKAREVVTVSSNCAKVLFTYLAPVTPGISEQIRKLYNLDKLDFSNIDTSIEEISLSNYEMLSKRVDEKNIATMIQDTKEAFEKNQMETQT